MTLSPTVLLFSLFLSPSVSLPLFISIASILHCSKVYLVIDGGRFYSYESVGSRLQRMYVQTTILGEYYFGNYIKTHPQFKTKPLQPILPSIYCQPLTKRPHFSTSDTQGTVESGGDSLGNLTIELPVEGHQIHVPTFGTRDETFAGKSSNMVCTL